MGTEALLPNGWLIAATWWDIRIRKSSSRRFFTAVHKHRDTISPDKILKEWVDPAVGIQPFQARKIASGLGLQGDVFNAAVKLILGVYKTWWECDATMVEINPLAIVETPNGKESIVCVDAKIGLDDNALYRHKDIQEMRDLAEESPLEIEASKHSLNYIKLDGSIACLVNGAGLAMSTMDIIQHYGGMPANFLDVGGGASKDQVTAAFKIILSDPNVKAIFVNIFGGIMDCNVIATGIVEAVVLAYAHRVVVVAI